MSPPGNESLQVPWVLKRISDKSRDMMAHIHKINCIEILPEHSR